MDGPTKTSLEQMKVKDIHELAALDTAAMMERLADAPFPPSEKLIGAVLLGAVDDLRKATADVAASSRQIDKGTGKLRSMTRAWRTRCVFPAARHSFRFAPRATRPRRTCCICS